MRKLEVQADESKVALAASAKVEEAGVVGDAVKIYGYGKLSSAEVTGASANVSVFGTKVEGENDTSVPEEIEQLVRPSSGSDTSAKPTAKPTAAPTAKPTAAPTPTGTPEPTGTPDTPSEEVNVVTVTSPSGVVFKIGLDAEGQMVTQKRYSTDGTLLGSNIVSYDSEGRLSKVVCYDLESNEVGKVEYLYASEQWQEYIHDGQDNVEAAISLTVDGSGNATASFVAFEEGKGRINVYQSDGSLYMYGIVMYDEHGNMTSLTAYEADGTVSSVQRYENLYHDNGNLKQVTEYLDDWVYSISLYDEQGILLSREVFFTESGSHSRLTEYYPNGEIKRTTERQQNVISMYSRLRITINEYDENGKQIGYEYYEYQNDVLVDYEIREVEYDNNGVTIGETYYDPDGNIIDKYNYEYTYFESGNLKQLIVYNKDHNIVESYVLDEETQELTEWKRYDYDEEGVLTGYRWMTYDPVTGDMLSRIEYNADGSIEEKMIMEYQEDGSRIQTNYDGFGNVTLLAKTDTNGNWVEKTQWWYDEAGELERYDTWEYAHFGDDLFGNDLEISWTAHNPDGSVKFKELKEYYENGTQKQSERYEYEGDVETYHSIATYNTEGRSLSVTYYYDGIITEKHEYEYYEDERTRKTATEYTYDDEGTLVTYLVITYDTEGGETGRIEYDAEGNVLDSYGYQYTYYDSGYVKEAALVNAAGDVQEYKSYTDADANGRQVCLKSAWYTYEDGELVEYEVYERNEAGQLISHGTFDADGSVITKWEYEYHPNGYEKVRRFYQWFGIDYCVEYDEQGNRIKLTDYDYYNGGNLKSYEVTTYDSEGNVTGTTVYDAEGNVIGPDVWQYTYYESGYVKEATLVTVDGDVLEFKSYTDADTDGEQVCLKEVTYYYDAGELIAYDLVERNEAGKTTCSGSFAPDDSVIEKSVYEYYGDGTLKSYECYDNYEDVKRHWITVYNTKGKALSEMYYCDDVMASRDEYEYYEDEMTCKKATEYSYDVEGTLVTYLVITYDTEGAETGRTEYDAGGNVITE